MTLRQRILFVEAYAQAEATLYKYQGAHGNDEADNHAAIEQRTLYCEIEIEEGENVETMLSTLVE